jgi:uncharacterized membrane protein YGL010W
MGRRIDDLLAEYGESHQDHTNKKIHWICVPVIVWTVMALFHAIPTPDFLAFIPGFDWLLVVLILAMIYYVTLSPPLAIGFVIFAAISLLLIWLYEEAFSVPIWKTAVVLFMLAWVGQFWGHKIEGRKPSFFKDIQFLLVGPAWLMSFVYRRLGFRY